MASSAAAAISGRRSRRRALVGAPPLPFGEVDDQRDALEPVAVPESVLDEVCVVTGEAGSAVDLNGEARWQYPDLGHVEHLQPVTLLGRRLPGCRNVGQKAVQLRGGNPVR